MSKNLLIVFVKNPELGKCKTRLAATIGDEKALTFYKNMLEHTRSIVDKSAADKHICYSAFIDHDDLWPNNETYSKQLQVARDLGDRMLHAIEHGFKAGYEKVCIIGSDCYDLTSAILEEAFNALARNQAVIGPSTDGGYYLLGMTHPMPELFKDKAWSTNSVTADTEADLKRLGKPYQKLRALTDIDNEADLRTLPEKVQRALLAN